MKRVIILLILILVIAGCEPAEEPASPSEEPEATVSECDSYSEGGRKVMCYAMEAEDVTMCGDITDRFRDSCVVALAELVHDTSLTAHCSLAEAEANQKMCVALFAEDIDRCFDWGQGEGLGTSLSVRDCIDLTSRKLRDKDLCDTHVERSADLMYICGDTQDCEGQWITGAQDNAESCKYAVEEALQYD